MIYSTLARILTLVQDAAERKAPAELFIRSLRRIYTPIVVLLAFLIVALPALVCGCASGIRLCVAMTGFYRGLVISGNILPLCIGYQHPIGLIWRE